MVVSTRRISLTLFEAPKTHQKPCKPLATFNHTHPNRSVWWTNAKKAQHSVPNTHHSRAAPYQALFFFVCKLNFNQIIVLRITKNLNWNSQPDSTDRIEHMIAITPVLSRTYTILHCRILHVSLKKCWRSYEFTMGSTESTYTRYRCPSHHDQSVIQHHQSANTTRAYRHGMPLWPPHSVFATRVGKGVVGIVVGRDHDLMGVAKCYPPT